MKKKHIKVIRDLQAQVPKDLMEKLIKREKMAPTVDFVMNKALEDKTVSQELKGRIRTLQESGTFNKEVDVVDRDVEEKLSKWWDEQITKAQKAGKLPTKADMNDPLIKKALQATKRANDKRKETAN